MFVSGRRARWSACTVAATKRIAGRHGLGAEQRAAEAGQREHQRDLAGVVEHGYVDHVDRVLPSGLELEGEELGVGRQLVGEAVEDGTAADASSPRRVTSSRTRATGVEPISTANPRSWVATSASA